MKSSKEKNFTRWHVPISIWTAMRDSSRNNPDMHREGTGYMALKKQL
ncbi:hypothetical protein [Algoriphagus marinus]|nr:hypothetical protein [Algoriphagus marinus]